LGNDALDSSQVQERLIASYLRSFSWGLASIVRGTPLLPMRVPPTAVTEAEMIGREYGVQGTPAWLLDKRLITGLRSAAELERLAEYALQSAL
jgi:hypothetical protein